jgi:hypothetical protein
VLDSALTDESGSYRVGGLRPGNTYLMRVRLDGRVISAHPAGRKVTGFFVWDGGGGLHLWFCVGDRQCGNCGGFVMICKMLDSALTDESGGYRVGGLRPGNTYLMRERLDGRVISAHPAGQKVS